MFLPPSPSVELFKVENTGVPAPSNTFFVVEAAAFPKPDLDAKSAKLRLFVALKRLPSDVSEDSLSFSLFDVLISAFSLASPKG